LVFQNFEPDNGTPEDDYFWDAWFTKCSLSAETVHEGERALCCEAFGAEGGTPPDTGGTVGIKPSSIEPIDLSSARTFSVWVYDTVGDNTVQLKLCDANGCPGRVWSNDASGSEAKADRDQWTKITWPTSVFTTVTRSAITHIEIYEWNDGLYCFDTIGWE
jgi:hypothetical protein